MLLNPSASPFPLPLLVTGIAGVAGYNALAYFQAKYPGQVIGIRQTDNVKLAGPGILSCNAEDEQGMSELFQRYQFRSVLDCAGNCALKVCELAPETAWRINYLGVRNLLKQVLQADIRYVHLSIDLVYSGEGFGGYEERMPPDPVTVYGKSMAAAEQLILERYPRACQLRISLPMGVSFNGHAGAIDWIQARFMKNRPATLYFDEVRTPTYTDCLNLVFERVLASDIQGLYHTGGPRRLSLYQIAQIVNRLGGYDPRLLHGIPRKNAGPMPPRAGNVTMNSTPLTTLLGQEFVDPWPFSSEWTPSHENWHYERSSGIPGSQDLLRSVLYANPRRGELARPNNVPGFPRPLDFASEPDENEE